MHKKAGTLSIVCLLVIGTAVASMPLFAQRASAQAVTWARTYGGPGDEKPYSIQQTLDGGYIVAGETTSFGSGGNNWGNDVWVLKLNSLGAVQWEKTYGDEWDNVAQMARQTSDGGYIVAGLTDTGDTWWDAWILKLDSDGNVEWQKAYGKSDTEYVDAIAQTSDGGYVFVGTACYWVRNKYFYDLWIVRLDALGNVIWEKSYDQGYEWGISIQQTSDGGFIVGGGISYSVGTKKNIVNYNNVVFLMKLDSSGAVTWQKQYGGWTTYNFEYGYGPDVRQTPDGGYVVAATTASSGDIWIFKVDTTGGMVWQERMDGGTSADEGASISLTSDGGYVVAGKYGIMVLEGGSYVPKPDFWVIKMDGVGTVQWQKTYGGPGSDGIRDTSTVQQTSDGGYVVTGSTDSYGAGGRDIWVLKMDENGNIGGCTVPGCGVDTFVTPVPGTTTPVATSMTPRITPYYVANSATTVMDSAATVNTQCNG